VAKRKEWRTDKNGVRQRRIVGSDKSDSKTNKPSWGFLRPKDIPTPASPAADSPANDAYYRALAREALRTPASLYFGGYQLATTYDVDTQTVTIVATGRTEIEPNGRRVNKEFQQPVQVHSFKSPTPLTSREDVVNMTIESLGTQENAQTYFDQVTANAPTIDGSGW
jgi:hypothetical protein